jgi:hypothetical protein
VAVSRSVGSIEGLEIGLVVPVAAERPCITGLLLRWVGDGDRDPVHVAADVQGFGGGAIDMQWR